MIPPERIAMLPMWSQGYLARIQVAAGAKIPPIPAEGDWLTGWQMAERDLMTIADTPALLDALDSAASQPVGREAGPCHLVDAPLEP